MALRLLPFRDYNEKNVINLFSLDTQVGVHQLDDPDTNGDNDNGVFVSISSGDLNLDPILMTNDTYLGKTHASPVGRNQYPINPLRVKPATTGETVIGVTLNQTLQRDENGEKLIYYPVKRDELQAVVPGQSVPVLAKGLITVTADAVYDPNGYLAVGDAFKLVTGTDGTTQTGKIGPTEHGVSSDPNLGTVLGTGSRAAGDAYAGNYYLLKLDA
jgi:hypothetical protein